MIFPDIAVRPQEQKQPLPLYRDWAFDETTGQLATRGDKNYYTEGLPALKTWIWKALSTKRNTYVAYGPNFGGDLHALRGISNEDILCSELQRLIKEALLVSPYITSVDGFSFSRKNDTVHVSCTVKTVYGETEVNYDYI